MWIHHRCGLPSNQIFKFSTPHLPLYEEIHDGLKMRQQQYRKQEGSGPVNLWRSMLNNVITSGTYTVILQNRQSQTLTDQHAPQKIKNNKTTQDNAFTPHQGSNPEVNYPKKGRAISHRPCGWAAGKNRIAAFIASSLSFAEVICPTARRGGGRGGRTLTDDSTDALSVYHRSISKMEIFKKASSMIEQDT